jgi:hypothetical protein
MAWMNRMSAPFSSSSVPEPDGKQPLLLAVRAQRVAVGLAAVEQVALVALQGRPVQLLGTGQAALVAPDDEGAQVGLPPAHRFGGKAAHFQVDQVALQMVIQAVRVLHVAYRRLGQLDEPTLPLHWHQWASAFG